MKSIGGSVGFFTRYHSPVLSGFFHIEINMSMRHSLLSFTGFLTIQALAMPSTLSTTPVI